MSKKQEKTATTEKIQRQKIITLPLILSLIGVIISLLLIERFYTFEPFYYLTGQYPYPFMPYGNLVVKEEWITTTVLLGQWSLGICLLLTVGTLVFRKKTQLVKILGILSILVSINFFSSFYFIHKDYNYEFNPYLFGYMTLDGKYIAKVDRYFETVEKYGFEPDAYRPFQTLDDAIQGLEFAKEKEYKLMYEYIFDDLERFGYENVFKKYSDRRFYLYFLSKMLGDFYIENYYFFEENIDKLDTYISLIRDKESLKLYRYLNENYKQIKLQNGDVSVEEFDYIDNYLREKINQFSGYQK